MIYRILVPFDGSENSKAALREAIKIAKLKEGKITVMHVYLSWSIMHTNSEEALDKTLKNKAEVNLLMELPHFYRKSFNCKR